MSFNFLDPWGLDEEADARETERRRRLGGFGRLKEDVPPLAKGCLLIGAFSAATFVPWFVGVYVIGSWIFGEAL